MQVCTSLQTDNHVSNPPLSFFQAGCPSCHPTNSIKALKAHLILNKGVFSTDTVMLISALNRLTAQVDWLGLRVGGHPALNLHSSDEPGELSQ